MGNTTALLTIQIFGCTRALPRNHATPARVGQGDGGPPDRGAKDCKAQDVVRNSDAAQTFTAVPAVELACTLALRLAMWVMSVLLLLH